MKRKDVFHKIVFFFVFKKHLHARETHLECRRFWFKRGVAAKGDIFVDKTSSTTTCRCHNTQISTAPVVPTASLLNFNRRIRRILFDRFYAVFTAGQALISLADGNDLTIAGFQTKPPLPVRIAIDFKYSRHNYLQDQYIINRERLPPSLTLTRIFADTVAARREITVDKISAFLTLYKKPHGSGNRNTGEPHAQTSENSHRPFHVRRFYRNDPK